MVQHYRNKPGDGFTIAELLMVMMIIGIVSAIVPAVINNHDRLEVEAAGSQLASMLTYAQSRAVTRQERLQMVFNPCADSYELQAEDGAVLDDPVKHMPYGVSNPQQFQMKMDFPNTKQFRQVKITQADFDGSETIWFDQLGAPHGGSICAGAGPMSSGVIALLCGSETITLSVEPITGKVQVQ